MDGDSTIFGPASLSSPLPLIGLSPTESVFTCLDRVRQSV